jgi:putative oxidoreductase
MDKNDDLAKLIIRLSLAILMLFHGYHYLYGMTNVDNNIAAWGMPRLVGDAGQWVGEIIAPLALILGVYTRVGGLMIVCYMIVAIVVSHTFAPHADLFMLNDPRGKGDTIGDGYKLELQAMYLFTALSLLIGGGGKYGLNIGGKWN